MTVRVMSLVARSDARGSVFNVELPIDVAECHVATIRPGAIRGNHFHLQRSEVLEVILRGLSKKEQAVLVGYYVDGLTMKQIGENLALSESRVCQIHMEVLKSKRKKMGAYDDFNLD